jgi:heterodisulfide reductase subunit A-like polyferredoxin
VACDFYHNSVVARHLSVQEAHIAANLIANRSTCTGQGAVCAFKRYLNEHSIGATLMPITYQQSVNLNNNIKPNPAAVMVIGGGIGGMRAALDLADAGLKVYLIEQSPCLGGRVAQLGYMFPQHDCVLCRGTPDHGYGCTRPSISPAYIQQNQHPNIEILTNTHVIDVAGQAGDFSVSLRQMPRFVDTVRCISC